MDKIRKKFIEYVLYLFAFVITLQTRWIIRPGEINGGYSEYLTISLYGTDILLVFLIVLHAAGKFKTAEFLAGNYAGTERQSFLRETMPEQNGRVSCGKLCRNRIAQLKLQITNYKLQKISKFQILNSKILITVFGLAASSAFSIFFAQDKFLAVYKFGVLMLGIGLFWLIVGAEYDKMKFIGWFLAGIGLQAGLAIWQFLTQSGFANKWLGIALHNAAVPGASVIEVAAGGRWLRAYGGLDHPNMLGGIVAIGIIILLRLLTKDVLPAFRPGLSGFSSFLRLKPCEPELKLGRNRGAAFFKIIIIFAYFLLLASLFFTFSRAAWAGLAIGAAAIAAGLFAQKDFFALKRLIKLSAAGFLLISILSFIFNDLVFTRVAASGRLEAKSANERMASMEEAVDLIKGNWLFGAGIGNYINEIKAAESPVGDVAGTEIISADSRCLTACEAVKHPSWHYQPAHNVFLLVWSEIGLLGIASFASLLLITYYLLFKQFKNQKNISISLALLTTISAMFLVDHWWWSLHFGVLLFWFVLGLVFIPEKN